MSKENPLDNPEYKESIRRKEGAIPLSDAEKSKILEHLKAVHKLIAIEDLAKLMKIPWYRQHQIYSSLKGENSVKFFYYKGEWFVECQTQAQP